jgi:hypothetical protein
MMKYSDRRTMTDEQCRMVDRIYEIVESVLRAHGLFARRAQDTSYRDDLWENLCVYMFGSLYGLAILEDRGKNEMNPNVALEYGFMKALNRKVGLLREMSFQNDRADFAGKLVRPFVIKEPFDLDEKSLRKGLVAWLKDAGVPPKRGA